MTSPQNQFLLKSPQTLKSKSSKIIDEKQVETQSNNLYKLMCPLCRSIRFNRWLKNQILRQPRLKFWWKWISSRDNCLLFGIILSKLQWLSLKSLSIYCKKIFIRKFEIVGLSQYVERSFKLRILLKQTTSIWVKSIINKHELYDIHLIIKTFLNSQFKKQRCFQNTMNIQYFLKKSMWKISKYLMRRKNDERLSFQNFEL